MTDSSPVVKIKDAYKIMLAEIKAMDVRMGVLAHTILQYKSKEKIIDRKNKIVEVDELEDLQWFSDNIPFDTIQSSYFLYLSSISFLILHYFL